ncbi:hypothetical protein T484DRAFT_1927175 [Baffinella frigidus]|nr:hypothetical protein T484DRAFT_1927175 [Cryptophyta sp. CCMP2293]
MAAATEGFISQVYRIYVFTEFRMLFIRIFGIGWSYIRYQVYVHTECGIYVCGIWYTMLVYDGGGRGGPLGHGATERCVSQVYIFAVLRVFVYTVLGVRINEIRKTEQETPNPKP